jgi:hypothetical protein
MRNKYTEPKPPDLAPLVALRAHLQAARERGEAFADAWPPAVAVALKGLSLADRREWRTALFRTQETWQACYERRPEMKVEEQLSFMRDGREEAA